MSTETPDIMEKPEPIILHSARLDVELAKPGDVYRGTRFDWTGFVTQVTLDGKHTFCVPESYEPGKGTGGIGLCNEFGNEMGLGYEEAKPGEFFAKLGIGLLARADDSPYNFFRSYEIKQTFPTRLFIAPDRVDITVEPLDCRGYAARLEKTISVAGNELTIAYRLTNVGTRLITTTEYAHNFLGINQALMGPGYCLKVPYPIKFETVAGMLESAIPRWLNKLLPQSVKSYLMDRIMKRLNAVLDIKGNELRLRHTPKLPFYCRLAGFTQMEAPQWELAFEPAGVKLSESDSFAPMRLAVWGTTHVISAEVFIAVAVAPGESQSWTRRYVFDAPAS